MKNFKIVFLLVFIFCTFYAYADGYGKVKVGAYGNFPAKGYYCKTNAFPVNSIITLKCNEKSAEVYVVSALDDASVMYLVSADVGTELGIAEDSFSFANAVMVKKLNKTYKTEEENKPDILDSKNVSSKKVYPITVEPLVQKKKASAVKNSSGKLIEPEAPAPLKMGKTDNKNETVVTENTVAGCVSSLASGMGYIQLGGFSTLDNARDFINGVSVDERMIVYLNNGNYKVLSGPFVIDVLDEKLDKFKEAGYKDAFKKINE